MSLNKVMLIGNAGKDPEIRHLENGVAVVTLPVATTERYKDRNGEVKEQTEWHNVVFWRGLADIVERFVRKGSQLFIEGKLRTRSWEDQSGQKKYITEIVAENLRLLGRRGDNDNHQQQTGNYQQQNNKPAITNDTDLIDGTEADDLPF